MHSLSAGGTGAVPRRGQQAQPFYGSIASDDAQARTTSGACSVTPNARASRLFRERRKEREKVLRNTVAELAERNIALESLLLSHGITPPLEATFRKELVVHKSQDSGGPPIHIPGLTSARPPPIESTNSQSVRQIDDHPFQSVRQPSLSSILTGSCSSGRSYGGSFHALSETRFSPDVSLGISSSLPDSSSRTVSSEQAFCDMLQTHAEAISPTHTTALLGSPLANQMRGFQITNLALEGTHAPLTSSVDGSNRMSRNRPDLSHRHSLHAFVTGQDNIRQDFISWDYPALYQPFHAPEQRVAHPQEGYARLQASDVGMSAKAPCPHDFHLQATGTTRPFSRKSTTDSIQIAFWKVFRPRCVQQSILV